MRCVHVGLYAVTQLIAVHHGHHNVRHDKLHAILGEHAQSLLSVSSSVDIECLAEIAGKKMEHVGIVLDDKKRDVGMAGCVAIEIL